LTNLEPVAERGGTQTGTVPAPGGEPGIELALLQLLEAAVRVALEAVDLDAGVGVTLGTSPDSLAGL
jgi:hypothetical protein